MSLTVAAVSELAIGAEASLKTASATSPFCRRSREGNSSLGLQSEGACRLGSGATIYAAQRGGPVQIRRGRGGRSSEIRRVRHHVTFASAGVLTGLSELSTAVRHAGRDGAGGEGRTDPRLFVRYTRGEEVGPATVLA